MELEFDQYIELDPKLKMRNDNDLCLYYKEGVDPSKFQADY